MDALPRKGYACRGHKIDAGRAPAKRAATPTKYAVEVRAQRLRHSCAPLPEVSCGSGLASICAILAGGIRRWDTSARVEYEKGLIG